ncbi:hypothetical protein [Legionella pneumophila]|uniref:hypothetical protein n=1 Tax=Legionella pneumophila TaxID=446 RepID=UPI000D0693B4|nr:hypothetical protein [Legionella pneumophila]HAT6977304.1 hypothetical protein [Legionella pneumophila]HBC0466342.1 hypothetical protein [Legionella pneumophila]HBD9374488.1 hypothetical protein [Legionella pneumophila]
MSIDKYLYLIEKFYSKKHADQFSISYLYSTQIELLQQSCRDVLQMLPPQPYECALLSACLVERARQAGLSCYLVAGSLSLTGRTLFEYDPAIEHKNIVENWSGHCWVIINDTIAEISLFRTAYSEKSPTWLKNQIIEHFGEQRGAILATISEIKKLGLYYTPEYVFNDLQLSGLLNYAEQIISKTWNIPLDSTSSRIACPVPGFSNSEIPQL